MGNGSIRLWEDLKCNNQSLRECYPRIFALSVKKCGAVEEFGRWIDDKWVWEVSLRRDILDWEHFQWNNFSRFVNSVKVRKDVGDKLAWLHSPKGIFSVGSFRSCLEGGAYINNQLFKLNWKDLCPPKVEIWF